MPPSLQEDERGMRMHQFDVQPHAYIRPSLRARRFAFGRFVVTLSVNREAECEPSERIANRVAELRREHDLSREQLADLLHIHTSTLIATEEGRYLPSLRLALRMSKLFDLPLEALFFFPADEGHMVLREIRLNTTREM